MINQSLRDGRREGGHMGESHWPSGVRVRAPGRVVGRKVSRCHLAIEFETIKPRAEVRCKTESVLEHTRDKVG
jgi:hypothetical protein